MSYRSAAIVAIAVPLGWSFTGVGCSDSATGGYDPDAAVTGGGKTCLSDKDCKAMNLLCDTQRSVCVECVTALDCGDTDAAAYECNAGKCEQFVPCTNSLMCRAGQVCDKQRSRCVECTQDGDCPMGGKCVGDRCRKGCASDKDCVVDGLLCDFTSSSCVSCLKNADCGDGGLSCFNGSCQKQLCTPGTKSCLGGGVATCTSAGDGWGNIILCDVPCTTAGGIARCGSTEVMTIDASLPVQGCGSADLVDDMEDGDGYICRANGRVGQWYTYGSNITPVPPGPPPVTPISPSAGRSGAARQQLRHAPHGLERHLGRWVGAGRRSAARWSDLRHLQRQRLYGHLVRREGQRSDRRAG